MPKTFSIHPGDILLTDRLRLAKELHVPASRINDVVRGKCSISADTALRLGIHFGLPAQFWMNLQNDYDIRQARVKPRVAA